jgi:hypothetical protein
MISSEASVTTSIQIMYLDIPINTKIMGNVNTFHIKIVYTFHFHLILSPIKDVPVKTRVIRNSYSICSLGFIKNPSQIKFSKVCTFSVILVYEIPSMIFAKSVAFTRRATSNTVPDKLDISKPIFKTALSEIMSAMQPTIWLPIIKAIPFVPTNNVKKSESVHKIM